MAQPTWNTAAGLIGSYPSLLPMTFQLSATPVTGTITYALISGSLPSGLTLTSLGLISGTPTLVTSDVSSGFTVRATDTAGNLRDRTFTIVVSGSAIPQFTTPSGSILSTQDSLWISLPIAFTNPDYTNAVVVRVKEGELPPGLEINYEGVIRGYASPPVVTVTKSPIITNATATSSVDNSVTVTSTVGFTIGRPVLFSGTAIGDLTTGIPYYIKNILSPTTFTLSSTQYGSEFPLIDATGVMTVTLPAISVGEPTIRTYNFTLELISDLGGDISNYSITVINQNVPVSQGGPGFAPNTRLPVILNTRPLSYEISPTDPYYGYYILPPVAPTQFAQMGAFQSGTYIAFKVIGNDFDGSTLSYNYHDLPTGLVGDSSTGWITGTITLSSAGISSYNFSVSAYKTNSPVYSSQFFNFAFTVQNSITSNITWLTDSNLGNIFNGAISTFFVKALSDVDISYRITSGSLPPNLELTSSGEIAGRVADQPIDTYLLENTETTFTFTVQVYSSIYPSIISSKTFTINVIQEFSQPTDILYIKAAPPINDRRALATLLGNSTIFPEAAIYRPDDIYFGKASSVIYEHAYGIYASDVQMYIAAVTRNHYWRSITLGEIKTAVARNDAGEIIYEVVYSDIIDNLVNPQGVSVSNPVTWPRTIDLGLGPWYTSSTDIFTSYAFDVNSLPTYYTSLTPGYANTLYPNSLYNMRTRVADVLGQELNSKVLPTWMTSQQVNGSTLGFTQAWVICYTKPGFASTIKTNIETLWPFTLNQINFQIDRFSVNKSATYDYDNKVVPAAWTGLPSASPQPDPLDSKDFYVLFPRQTILPDQSQY